MKLHNKETGEVKFVECIEMRGVCHVNFGNYKFNSLAELNEEWEDYKPVEPLIKDPKIRKAIRAWAEALGANKVSYASDICSFWSGPISIEFDRPPIEPNLDKTYTITELCGEEEE